MSGTEPITDVAMNGARWLKLISRSVIDLDTVDLLSADRQGISVFLRYDASAQKVSERTLGFISRVIEGDAA